MLWDSEECTINVEWALLTLRQLCFDKDCKARIIAEMPATQLVQSYTPEGAIAEAGTALDTLNRIIELDPPSVLERTRDTGATLGILASNLKDQVYIVHTVDNVVAASREDADNKWVMISYNWDVQDQAKEVCCPPPSASSFGRKTLAIPVGGVAMARHAAMPPNQSPTCVLCSTSEPN